VCVPILFCANKVICVLGQSGAILQETTYGVLQRVAVCVLQRVAVCCSVLQCVAVQCVAVARHFRKQRIAVTSEFAKLLKSTKSRISDLSVSRGTKSKFLKRSEFVPRNLSF